MDKLIQLSLGEPFFEKNIIRTINASLVLILSSLHYQARNSFTGSIPHMSESLNLKVLDARKFHHEIIHVANEKKDLIIFCNFTKHLEHNGFSGNLNHISILKTQNTKLEIVALSKCLNFYSVFCIF